MSEPRKVTTLCSSCGDEAYSYAIRLRYRTDRSRGNPQGEDFREAVLGGDRCDLCSDRAERHSDQEEAFAVHDRNLEGSNLPARLRGVDFSGFPQREAVESAKRWSTGRLAGLCLTGDVGVGKTWLAAAAMWPLLFRRRVRWVDTAQLLTSLGASFGDEHRAVALRVVAGSGPAVFDDLDKVNPTEYARQALFAALNARTAAGSPLLVTTNVPISGLGEILGKPIMSRLAGYCEVVEMVGPDRRIAQPELKAA